MSLQAWALAAALFAFGTISAAAKSSDVCGLPSTAWPARIAAAGFDPLGDDQDALIKHPPGKLVFPNVGLQAGIEGNVSVLVLIDKQGMPADRVVLCASPFGYFEPTILAWLKDMRFPSAPASATHAYRGYIVTAVFKIGFPGAPTGSRLADPWGNWP